MAYGNANDIVVDMAREVLPVVKRTPVLAGINGTDPFMIKRAYHSLIQSAFAEGGRIREVDAASDYPFLKRQMGFAPQSFHAVLQGDPEWRHYIM